MLENIQLCKPPFLLIVGLKPDVTVRVAGVESFREGRWTRVKEIFGRNKVGGRSIVTGVWSEETTDGAVAGKKDVVST